MESWIKTRVDNLENAVCEARRFIEKAQAASTALITKQESTYHSPSFAAAKRATILTWGGRR